MHQSGWQTGNVNCMRDFTAKQPEYLPAYESRHNISANVGLNSYLFSGLPAELGIPEEDEHCTQKWSFFHLQTSPVAPNPYPNEQPFVSSHGQEGKVATHETTIPQRKKYFIFDRSGTETRVILSSLNPTAITGKPDSAYKFPGNFQFLNSEQASAVANYSCESHEEDLIIGEDSDYHEDTEELNALLYSDSDDISSDNRDEDEVSTGRSPLTLEEVEDADDEVSSWIRPLKRQKSLAFGSSNKLSSMATEPMKKRPPQLNEDETVVDVNTCGGESCRTVGSTIPSVRDRIVNKMKVLENLVPGSKNKDSLVILQQAIDYLKFLKAKANPLHVEEPQRPGFCGPRL